MSPSRGHLAQYSRQGMRSPGHSLTRVFDRTLRNRAQESLLGLHLSETQAAFPPGLVSQLFGSPKQSRAPGRYFARQAAQVICPAGHVAAPADAPTVKKKG